MSRRKKKDIIEIKIDPLKVKGGHTPHRGGGGVHDNRPRKLRTKADQNKQAIRDSQD